MTVCIANSPLWQPEFLIFLDMDVCWSDEEICTAEALDTLLVPENDALTGTKNKLKLKKYKRTIFLDCLVNQFDLVV